MLILGIAGSMALLLGVIGIYGVISYSVSQRRREMGIRLALGAQQGELKKMFVASGLTLVGIGAVLGLLTAVGLTRLMTSLLFGISPFDPVTYGSVVAVLAMAAVLASYLPARRAANVDPVEVLEGGIVRPRLVLSRTKIARRRMPIDESQMIWLQRTTSAKASPSFKC